MIDLSPRLVALRDRQTPRKPSRRTNPTRTVPGAAGGAGGQAEGRGPEVPEVPTSLSSPTTPTPAEGRPLGTSRTSARTTGDADGLGNAPDEAPDDADALDDVARAKAAARGRRRFRRSSGEVLNRAASRAGEPVHRVWHCGRTPAGGDVPIVNGPNGHTARNLMHCANAWLCAVCSATIRYQRARQIEWAVDAWHRLHPDGAVLFLSLTCPHGMSDRLADLLDGIVNGWSRMTRSEWWTGSIRKNGRVVVGARARYGVGGTVRVIETPHGANGWHTHAHALVFVSRSMTQADALAFGDEVFDKWSHHLVRSGLRAPSRRHGLDVQVCGPDGRVLADYLAKLSDTDIGLEMARGDLKTGRRGSLSPFELADLAAKGDAEAERLFLEYADATKGRRIIAWSQGLREALGVPEIGDEALVAEITELDEAFDADVEPTIVLTNEEWTTADNIDGAHEVILDACDRGVLDVAHRIVRIAVEEFGAAPPDGYDLTKSTADLLAVIRGERRAARLAGRS